MAWTETGVAGDGDLGMPQVPVLAVASGKGGVGKTTVAVNLARAVQHPGRRGR
jgi:Mrp family chromosome partitioning ATPase